MNKKRVLKVATISFASIVSAVAAIISVPLFCSLGAHAEATVSADELYKKGLVVGLGTCYNSAYMNKEVNASGVTISKLLTSAGKTDGKVIIPTYVGNTLKDSDMSCEDILSGYSGSGGAAKSVFAAFGKPAFSSSATGTNLVSLGYLPIESEDTAPTGNYNVKVSFDYFKITNGSAGAKQNGYYTITLDSDGREISNTANSCYSSTTSAWPCVSAVPNSFWVQDGQLFGTIEVHGAFNGTYPTMGNGITITLFGTEAANFAYTGAIKCDGYYSDEQDVAYSCGSDGTVYKLSNFDVKVTFEADENQVTSSGRYEIRYDSYSSAAASLRLYLGASTYSSFSTNDKKSLYYDHYILSVLGDSTNGATYVDNSDCMDVLTSEAQNSSSDYYLPSGGKWCRLVGSENATVKKNPADNDYKFAIISSPTSMKKTTGTKAAAFQEIVKELMKISSSIDISDTQDIADEVEDATNPTTPSNPNEGGEDGDDGTVATCFNSAGSLGWILCPVIGAVGDVTSGLYNIIKASFLEIKSDFMSTDNGTYEGWKIFRDIANVLFVIMFVIVILAQVTGIGISNYNIKKILPRLVMVVALVNISFILCQFAVDISNVLGNGLEQMFSNIRFKGATAFDLGDFVVGLLGTLGVGAFAVGGAAIAISTWELWLIPLLLTLLACLISILFFFILLGVRQAGVIILVVLAPVAIVCYALPNAKSIFDKWRKMFVALLMVYPICGLLMGGGKFASMLLLTVGNQSGEDINFFYNLVAMLLQVVPFFFIPSILKSSMAAMGNLGMKISNMGTRWGNAARRTVGNSRIVQERQRELARNNNQRRDLRLASRYKASADATNSQVKGFENRLRGAGIDLSDDKAVRRFLGNEYGAYRRAKNKQASMNYRTNQARKRYESSVMEDAAAATGASRELLTPGTRRYESYMEGLESAQRIKDAADQQRLFEAGRGTYTDASGTVHDINAGDIASLGDAHARFLEQLRDNPNDVETRAKLEAVQDMLAARGDKGHEAMYRNYESLANSSTADQLKSDGLRYAANHLSKYTPQIKKGSRSFDKLLNQYQAGTVDSFRSTATANGKTLEEELDTNSALGYNASSFNDMNENAIQRYIDMAEHGKLDSKQLQHLTKIANEALNNDQIQLKGDVEKQLHDFLSAAYGTGAVGHSTLAQGQSTIGSDAIKNASLSSLNDVAQRIQNNDITGAAATKLVENARRYMESGETIDADRAQALRKIISTAQAKGVDSLDKINDVNAGDNFNYDEASFKVRGAKATAKMPTGWTRNASGTWVNITSGAPLTPTEVRKAEEIERYNNQRDIESGKYS